MKLKKKELTFLFDTIYRWADYISDSSRDYSDDRKAKVVEDLFIEMIGRLKAAEQVPDQEDPAHDVPTTLSIMINQAYAEESSLREQLGQIWRETERASSRFGQ